MSTVVIKGYFRLLSYFLGTIGWFAVDYFSKYCCCKVCVFVLSTGFADIFTFILYALH